MRKLTLILTTLIFFSVMSSSTSFAEWEKVVTTEYGTTFYVDFERIRKHDGYVYYWELMDLLKPTKETGYWSVKTYIQGDCKKFRLKWLSMSFHKGPMGGGETSEIDNTPDKDWRYPHPDSSIETILKSVCQHANRWWGK